MKFLLFLFLGMTACASAGSDKASFTPMYMAVVRQYPSVLMKCNAFFVSKEYLVGTAACFFCNQNCTFQVELGKTDMFDDKNEVFDVAEVYQHPKYVNGLGTLYNIAVVKLQTPANNALVLSLANETIDDIGLVYSWGFSADMKRYSVESHLFRRIQKKICKEFKVPIDSDQYCAKASETPVSLGPNNEGIPYVVGLEDDEFMVVGFHSKIDNALPGLYFSFTSIPYYYTWIMSIISK